MASESVLCEGLRANGLRAGLAHVPKGATERTITGRVFRDSGRKLRDGTRVFEPSDFSDQPHGYPEAEQL